MDPRQGTGGPWAVAVYASAASGVAPVTNMSVPGSTRRCFWGEAFEVTAYNLVTSALAVAVRASPVVDPIATANVVEIDQLLPGAGLSVDIPIPPFCRAFNFDVPTAQRAAVYVELVLPTGAVVGQYAWGEQPAGGIPLGGVQTIRFVNGSAAASARTVFYLE